MTFLLEDGSQTKTEMLQRDVDLMTVYLRVFVWLRHSQQVVETASCSNVYSLFVLRISSRMILF
jgi:hypothetical protein